MLTAPYSIYVHKRPQRVAFLVEDKLESMPMLDAILDHNRDRWGGRYNPIIVTDGQTLSPAWWSLLEAVDPDVVRSFVPLSDGLLAAIDRRISPYLIEEARREEGEGAPARLHHEGLTILPTPLNIRRASWAATEPILVLFQSEPTVTDPSLKRFTEWNFGGYPFPVQAESEALEQGRVQPYTITDAASLAAALTDLTQFRPFTFPIQLCSIPKEAPSAVEHDRFEESFQVVVGDSLADIAHWWNRPATLPAWNRSYMKQFWLPIAVAKNPELTRALGTWFQHAADPGGSHKGTVQFVSLSLSLDELISTVEPLRAHINRVFRDTRILSDIQPPKLREAPPGALGLDNMDLYRAASTTEHVTLREPDILAQGATWGGDWMADLYVEFRPERYPTMFGRPLWWQLPRLNELTLQMFKRMGRVLRTRYPSVLMRRGEPPRINLTLLDDLSIFRMLTLLENRSYPPLDARSSKSLPDARKPYGEAPRSEKGRYLSGLLDLFDGLHPATSVFEERYWRRMFDLLSGRNPDKEAAQIERVRNTLTKHVRGNPAKFYTDDKSMEWLTNYVLTLAQTLPSTSREVEWRDLEEHAKRELGEFNAAHAGQQPWEYSSDDLRRAVTALTERGVLLMGFQARCPSCGYRTWHHIDEVKQTLRCGGCNASFAMPPEQRWRYRLNSLARAAHAEHGLVPVVMVLGQLFMEARTGFIFAPCLDLFDEGATRPIGDLDIAVILDGKFIIGEVKQSRGLFDEATFRKMETIARRLLPDILLFSSMDREPSSLITRELKRLSEVLLPLGVAVRWYQLQEHIFEPSPIR